jgi:hypothetical protein
VGAAREDRTPPCYLGARKCVLVNPTGSKIILWTGTRYACVYWSPGVNRNGGQRCSGRHSVPHRACARGREGPPGRGHGSAIQRRGHLLHVGWKRSNDSAVEPAQWTDDQGAVAARGRAISAVFTARTPTQDFKKEHGHPVFDVRISPDNNRFASCGASGDRRPHRGRPPADAFSRGAGGDRFALFWDVATGTVVRKFSGMPTTGHTARVSTQTRTTPSSRRHQPFAVVPTRADQQDQLLRQRRHRAGLGVL